MGRSRAAEYVPVLMTERAEIVPAVKRALKVNRIPFDCGLQQGPPARTLFSVPPASVAQARAVLAPILARADDDDMPETRDREPARFPWKPLTGWLPLIGLHLALVLLMASPWVARRELLNGGGLLLGSILDEPWRLLTYQFLHADASHLIWNSLSLLVFAVPLVIELGYPRAGAIYLVAGIAGGVAALSFGPPGTVVIGSSAAVAGLFGAWIARRLRQARIATLGWRARVRALGIGLLVLPAWLTPTTPDGRQISVAGHLGGLVVGLAIGAFVAGRSDDPPGSKPSVH